MENLCTAVALQNLYTEKVRLQLEAQAHDTRKPQAEKITSVRCFPVGLVLRPRPSQEITALLSTRITYKCKGGTNKAN